LEQKLVSDFANPLGGLCLNY